MAFKLREWARASRRRSILYASLINELWRTARLLLLAAGLVVILSAILPIVFSVAVAAAVQDASGAIEVGSHSNAGGHLELAVGVVAILFFLGATLPLVRDLLQARLSTRIDGGIAVRVMHAGLAPVGIGHLESPDAQDAFRRVGPLAGSWSSPGTAAAGATGVGCVLAAAATSTVALGSLIWWLPLPLLALWLSLRRALRRDLLASVGRLSGHAAAFRRTEYLTDVALDRSFASEVALFGIGPWLIARYRAIWRDIMDSVGRARRRSVHQIVGTGLILLLVYLAVALEIVRASAGSPTAEVARAALYMQLLLRSAGFGLVSNVDLMLAFGLESWCTVAAILEKAKDAGGTASRANRPASPPRQEIVFDDVSFRYVERGPNVLRGLSLRIPVGASVALVGLNGAGKTTILKLLTRLYEPSEGAILVDGAYLSDFDARSWRRQVSVLFQDFTRYAAPLLDNIWYGATGSRRDSEAVRRSATLSGALGLVERLPLGLETPLSGQLRGGVSLSDGEWQRVALARALFAVQHGAAILVLDEPTANLDPLAESASYDRFLALTKGLTTIIVSHRFSTVRKADTIFVIDSGAVSEQGSHEELVAAGGFYARMFDLQAAAFRGGVR